MVESIPDLEKHLDSTKIVESNSNFNPFNNTICDNEIKKSETAFESFFKQIRENMNIRGRAMFVVCKDVYIASKVLKTAFTNKETGEELKNASGEVYYNDSEYKKLIKDLLISPSTERKYLSVGSSKSLQKAYDMGYLPKGWTVQYYLSTLTNEEFETVRPILTIDTTEAMIKKKLGIKKVKTSKPNYSFASIEVSKKSVKGREDYNVLKTKLDNFLEDTPDLICTFSDGLRHMNWSKFRNTLDEHMVTEEKECA